MNTQLVPNTSVSHWAIYILLWSIHFSNVAAKAMQYLMQLMGALNEHWGPKAKLVRWIYSYMAVVRPRITYGAMVWGHNINQKNKLKKLVQINRLASMMMGPARRSTPTKAVEVINNQQPLNIYLRCRSLKTYKRRKEHYQLSWTGRNPKFLA